MIVGANQFGGPFPVSFSNASRMKYLDLSITNLSGPVPFDLGRRMKDLVWLNVGRNNLGSGDAGDLRFVESLTNCSKLEILGFGENGFGGVLPTSIANLSKYGIGGRTSIEGDVYSYGILLLEMLIGKRPTDEMFTIRQSLHEFCKVALPERVMDIVDPRMLLEEPTEADNDAQNERVRRAKIRECLVSLVRIGIACSAEPPGERMNIKDVIIGLMTIKEVFLGVGIHGRRQMRR
ncbi:hypothetical protein C3L33_01530, partial [Rhododendron williamsianum]